MIIRIGVVSDTHMPSRGKALPSALVQGLQGVELILHAGDFTDPQVIDMLEQIAPVEAVAGNNDGVEIVMKYGKRRLLMLDGRKIGMIHGDGPSGTAEQRARIAFRPGEADVVIFGHSHVPYHHEEEGMLFFNPGSPTDKRWQPRYSYGILTLGDAVEAKHFYYSDKS